MDQANKYMMYQMIAWIGVVSVIVGGIFIIGWGIWKLL